MTQNDKTRPRAILLTLVAALFVWFFADALFNSGMFAFRDAAHFYYPLFQFTADEWAAGRVPLWNPYENLGMPLAANPAASVFYPSKLIFALPISYPWAYKIYVMAHLLLAAVAAYRLARHFGASVEAAGLCAVSYAFSGNVLFTYCNCVFLVGAAWLPAAILAADRMLVGGRGARGQGRGVRDQGSGVRDQGPGVGDQGRPRWAAAFGVVLALMVLGGDPQMAYNAVLLVGMYILWLWRHESPLSLWERVRVRAKQALFPNSKPPRPLTLAPHPPPHPKRERAFTRAAASRPALLVLAAATGLALSAVQVSPSLEFTRRSDRVPGPVGDRLLGHIEPGTHAEHTYDFSVGPWRLVEYVWPNLSGRQFPIHRRWIEVIPAEGRVWTPSLYMGLLPLLLALSAMRFGRRGGSHQPGEPIGGEGGEKGEGGGEKHEGNRPDGKDEVPGDRQTAGRKSPFSLLSSLFPLPSSPFLRPRSTGQRPVHPLVQPDAWIPWLSWSVVLAVLASFGWYGLGWLADEVYSAARGDPAGLGLVGAPCGGLYWLMTLVLPGYAYFRYPAKLLVVAALGLSLLAARGFDHVLARPSDRFRRGLLWLGGLSLCGAASVLAIRPFWDGWLSAVPPDPLLGPLDTSGAANDLLVAFLQTAVLCGLYWGLLRLATSGARWVALLALLLSAVDLAVANRWMIVCAPQRQWQEPSKVAAALQQHPSPGDGGPYRVLREPIWAPPAWKTRGSPDRLAEAVRWDRDTLWPQYNLSERISLAEVQGTMMPQDYAAFLSVAKRIDVSPARGEGRGARGGERGTRGEGRGTRGEGSGARGQGPGARGQGPGDRGQGSGVRDQGPGDTLAGLLSLARYVILPRGKGVSGAGPVSRPAQRAVGSEQWPAPSPLAPGPSSLAPRPSPLVPRSSPLAPRPSPLARRMNLGVEDASLWHNPSCLPRAWIVHQLEVLPPLASNDPVETRSRTEEVLCPEGRPRDLGRSAVVESAHCPLPTAYCLLPTDRSAGLGANQPPPPHDESCRVVHYDPLRVEIKAELARPGLVVFCDQFYPGWKLRVETAGQGARSVPILRANRVMRGAWLPEGRHRLTYRYRPASVAWGALISGLAWIALIVCVGGSVVRVASRALAVHLARRPGQRPARVRVNVGSPCATASQKQCGAECRITAYLASSSGTLR